MTAVSSSFSALRVAAWTLGSTAAVATVGLAVTTRSSTPEQHSAPMVLQQQVESDGGSMKRVDLGGGSYTYMYSGMMDDPALKPIATAGGSAPGSGPKLSQISLSTQKPFLVPPATLPGLPLMPVPEVIPPGKPLSPDLLVLHMPTAPQKFVNDVAMAQVGQAAAPALVEVYAGSYKYYRDGTTKEVVGSSSSCFEGGRSSTSESESKTNAVDKLQRLCIFPAETWCEDKCKTLTGKTDCRSGTDFKITFNPYPPFVKKTGGPLLFIGYWSASAQTSWICRVYDKPKQQMQGAAPMIDPRTMIQPPILIKPGQGTLPVVKVQLKRNDRCHHDTTDCSSQTNALGECPSGTSCKLSGYGCFCE